MKCILVDLKAVFFAIPPAVVLLAGILLLPPASAQFQIGGVDKDGEWHVGEGLKQGDYFSYRMCHVEYKECVPFVMDFWIRGDVGEGIENRWLAETVVYDGSKTVVGEMELGKIAPEPIGGSPELRLYREAFKSSIVWLSAFAVQPYPKEFRDNNWGWCGNLVCNALRPTAIETVTVPAGTWEETVLLTWRAGSYTSKAWLVDGFPFPIKASAFAHVNEGLAIQEYRFELLDYKENVQGSHFGAIVQHSSGQITECPQVSEKDLDMALTKRSQYQVHVIYSPEYPVQGCKMQWHIEFPNKFTGEGLFLEPIKFDLLVVDKDLKPIRSIAEEEGLEYLHSSSGRTTTVDMVVKEERGTAHFVVWIHEGPHPSFIEDYLQIDIPIIAPIAGMTVPAESEIPSPLAQHSSGVPIHETRCGDSRILMETPRGTPACVYERSVEAMQQRGWTATSKSWTAQYGDSSIPTVVIPLGSGNSESQLNFEPQTVKVTLGANNTVRWINQDETASSFVGDYEYDGLGFESPVLLLGDTWEFTFPRAGVFDYHGFLQPWKQGTVVVLESKDP